MNIKKFVPYIVGIMIAAGSFFTGAVTDVGDAVSIAVNKDAQIEACKTLIAGEYAVEAETTE